MIKSINAALPDLKLIVSQDFYATFLAIDSSDLGKYRVQLEILVSRFKFYQKVSVNYYHKMAIAYRLLNKK